jgi:hypothetical protein
MVYKPFSDDFPKQPFLEEQETGTPFLSYDEPKKQAERPTISYASRFRHIYVAGASQHGKSTLLERMIAQDMANNEGVTVLDPKGDLAEAVLHRVPPSRINDCIYLDIADPVPVDFMSHTSEQELQTLLANLNETFLRFSTMTSGDQWLSILRWTIYTLLVARQTCFLDIYYFLAHKNRHDEIFDRVRARNTIHQYDDIIHYWEEEFPRLKSPKEGPILTRMSPFTTSAPLKKILGTPEAKLNIFDCMEKKKILIVKLLGVGRQNGNLVGTLLTSKILQSAFSRQAQARSDRVPHFLYADEFQNFQTPDFEDILAEAGGFKLSLTLANQGIYQLDSKIKQAIFTNVNGARIAFRLNHEDVHNWKHYLPSDRESPTYIAPETLANLSEYTAFFAIGGTPPTIMKTLPPLPDPTPAQIDNAQKIRDNTLRDYTIPATSAQIDSKRTIPKPAGNAAKDVISSRDVPTSEGNETEPASLSKRPPKKRP